MSAEQGVMDQFRENIWLRKKKKVTQHKNPISKYSVPKNGQRRLTSRTRCRELRARGWIHSERANIPRKIGVITKEKLLLSGGGA